MPVIERYIVRTYTASKSPRDLNVIVEDTSLKEYVLKYGCHFNDALSVWASGLLSNKSDTCHIWSVEDVKTAYKNYGLLKPGTVSWGDATYLANRVYHEADPNLRQTGRIIILRSNEELAGSTFDPKYVFNHWVDEVKRKKEEIPWINFI